MDKNRELELLKRISAGDEGKIVDIDAARPSQPELKSLLDNLVKQ